MSRRRPHYHDDEEENLFDSYEEVERELFSHDDDETPCYEDPDEIDKLIEEELGTAAKRRKTSKRTK